MSDYRRTPEGLPLGVDAMLDDIRAARGRQFFDHPTWDKTEDERIREDVEELLKRAFAVLNLHSHGDDEQAAHLARTQRRIAQAVETLREIK